MEAHELLAVMTAALERLELPYLVTGDEKGGGMKKGDILILG